MSAMTASGVSAAGDALPVLDRYDVIEEIGRGGMAVVYLARHTDLDRHVALKELRLGHHDPAAARRFVQESRVAASLTHPNVVTVHDYFEHDGTPYIAMEHMPRGSLRPYVGHTTAAENIGVLEGLLAGLDHAARLGVVHRDIKPENLMVTAEGRVKIADFGIARASDWTDGGLQHTLTGVPVGTPAYMAPEQATAQTLGPWTDLWSVGIVAWELFTGHLPFRDSASAVAVLLRNVNEAVPPAATIEPSVDPAISDWIDRLLVKDPQDRVRCPVEAWDMLEEIATTLIGPRWRREARLGDRPGSSPGPAPLTPAPFTAPVTPAATTNDAMLGTDLRAALAAATDEAAAARTGADDPTPVQAERLPAAPAAPGRAPALRATAVRAAALGSAARDRATQAVAALRRHPGAAAAVAAARRRPTVLAAIAAVLAIAAGWLAGAGGGRAAGPDAVVLENSGLRLTAPPTWRPLRTAPTIPGLPKAHAVAAAPDATRRTGIAANLVTFRPPGLLPKETRAAVVGPVPAPTAVRLGDGVEAYRYSRLRLRGRPGVVTLYAVPTTDWVATLACFGPSALAARVDATCGSVAATLRPTGAAPVTVGPSRAFATRLDRVLADLGLGTTAPRRALATAPNAAAQATAAANLAHVYGIAAGRLDELPDRVVDGIAVAGLANGVGAAAEAYDQLAAAARTRSAGDYDRARAAVAAARGEIDTARRTLAASGYEVR